MRLKSVAILLSIVIFPLIGVGQSPPYINYKGGDQIPSSETYHVIQDTKGYIWVATACGVSRFDGYEFTTFTLKDGLPDNVIHEIYEDYKGRIWFVSYSGQLSYFFEGKIYPYKYNYLMTGIFAGGKGAVKCSFRVSHEDHILISVNRKGIFEIYPDGKLVKHYSEIGAGLIFKFQNDNTFPLLAWDISTKVNPTTTILADSSITLPIKDFVKINPSHLFATEKNGLFVISFGETYVICKGKETTSYTTTKPIIWISKGSDGLIWVSRYNEGVRCYNDVHLDKGELYKLFDGLSITSVCKDKEGGYWFSTYTHGLFYVSNLNSKTYFWHSLQFDHKKIMAIETFPKGLFVGFDNGDISIVNSNDTIESLSLPRIKKMDLYVNYIHYNQYSKDVLLLSNIFVYNIGNGQIQQFINEFTRKGSDKGISPRYAITYNTKTWIGTRLGLLIFDGQRVIYDSFKAGDFKSTVNALALAKNGTLWLGCSDGLWKFKNGKFEWMGEVMPFFRNRISRVAINPIDSSVWVGTRGGGIGVFNGSTLSFISTDDGLPSDIITSIAMGVDRVWVGSSSGVAQVSIVPDISGKYIVSGFDKSIGIVSNEILDLLPTDSTLIIGTRDGVLSYRLEDIRNQVKPKVLITKLSVNGRDTSVLNNLNLDYFQNNISISFAGFTYKTLRNTLFRYRLHESDSIYSYTRIPSVILPALSPGKYSFEVWAQNAYGQWSVSPAKFHFSILSPFWRMPWFVFLISVAGFLVFSFVFAFRLRVIKQHNILSRRLDGWKQQALLQQMNPHFIFNTLNSIQLFILQNDTRSSQRYLTKFAKLMRLTLENSQSFSVSFTNELEALRLYLDLEALRADKQFEFEIVVDGSLPLEANIPSLIVQPFVENAIWHGVMPKGKGGRIIVTFKFRENKVLCTIEDNGIGRVAASKYTSAKAHKSRGSEITTQRLQLLKSMYGQQLGIVYIDLKDSLDQPAGTRVELVIPILPAKNILD
ncbi:sensor histidine kinase [Williamwhitmania taraxaci]|uniref:sensor histidine kinase n=1 Tax=Williamwhitmania taraxaci TaxID=1640674 RepID=UPI00147A0913|nr:sensor histidine kinase [Williamwhitmania taraxaci]